MAKTIIERMCSIEYMGDKRTEFAFSAQGELTDLLVQKAERLGISGNVLSAYMVR